MATVSTAIPIMLIGCWMAFLGVTIWQHVAISLQTPWGDGLSYLQKAISFWNAIAEGRLFNPLNLEPTVRPPGTILMSYPFGMTDDHRGFHFRSIFLPLASIVVAVYIAAGRDAIVRKGWWVALAALLLSSLPMFYWFDWNEARWINNGWGMVDNFHAGVAALAAAALVRSIFDRSLAWLLVCASLACLTLLIKQSGMMVMAVLGLTWLMVVAFEWRSAPTAERRALRDYALRGAASFAVAYGAVIALCVFSGYLSGVNFAYAMRALGYYGAVAPRPTISLLYPSAGVALPIWLIGIATLFAFRSSLTRAGGSAGWAATTGFLVGSVLIWVLGVWYWVVVQAGGQQVRYWYPFLLMGAVCFVPAAMRVWPRASRWLRWPLVLVCVVPAANIAGLLVAGSAPSIAWQDRTGVSVSVAQDREEIAQARALLDEVRRSGQDARVYVFPNGVLPQTFIMVGAYEKMIRPALPSFTPVHAMDWSRGFVVRVQELLESEFVLTRKTDGGRSVERFAAAAFHTFAEETQAFDGWLATLGPDAGVQVASEGSVLRLLRIVDRVALRRAVERFVAEHEWRPDFNAENRPAPPTWWSSSSIAARGGHFAAENIDFGGEYAVRALAVERVDNAVKVEVWWRALRTDAPDAKRYLFLHLVDASGAILHIHQVPLQPYDPPEIDRPWRYGTAMFLDVLPNARLTQLAFGVYEPKRVDGGFIPGNADRMDWGGKRILVPIR